MLIDNVEGVDDEKEIVRRIGGVIRLKSFDKVDDIGVFDPLYFSFKSFDVFSLSRLFLEYRKLKPFVIIRSSDREVPNDMVETGSKVMDDFAGEHTKSWRDGAILVVRNRLEKQPAVVVWQHGVVAFLKESRDFRLETENVLFGPV